MNNPSIISSVKSDFIYLLQTAGVQPTYDYNTTVQGNGDEYPVNVSILLSQDGISVDASGEGLTEESVMQLTDLIYAEVRWTDEVRNVVARLHNDAIDI